MVVVFCGGKKGGGETVEICSGELDVEGDLTPRPIGEQRILRSAATLNISRRSVGLRAGVELNS